MNRKLQSPTVHEAQEHNSVNSPIQDKCVKHVIRKASIHHHDYDEDVFTCVRIDDVDKR